MPDPQELLLETSRFRVVRHRWRSDDGVVRQRESIQHPGAVVIVPWVSTDSVCLIRNYRIAVDSELIELPAGTLEFGEPPLAAAARELAEETGYRAGRLEPIHELLMSPGILNERMHVFEATDLARGKSSPQQDEQISVFEVSWHEALTMVADGRICDAKTVAALLLCEQRRRKR